MLDSLRARLVLWYALILALVIVTFACTVCYLYWRSLIRDIDRDLASAASAIAHVLRPTASGEFDLELPGQYREAEFIDRLPHTYFAVWDGRGELIDRSDPEAVLPAVRRVGTASRNGYRERVIEGVKGSLILVGRDLGEARRGVWALATTVGASGGAVLLLSLLGGWFLAGRALAPVARISRAASAMAGGDLSARIAVERTENELEQVALALNEAFDRLRLAADIQRRFTADASHELRTPLATLRARFDWALRRPRTFAEYAAMIETCRRAVDRMAGIVDELLMLAREDAAALPVRRERVALPALVQDVIGWLQPIAAERQIAIDAVLEPAFTTGDAERLGDVVANLVENAIDYNRDGGQVSVAVWSEGSDACVRVRDTGIGIAADEVPRVFDRFYRVDKARTRKAGGSGLGLAIAKRIVESHAGEITCRSELGRGAEFTVRLPALQQVAEEDASRRAM